MSHGDDPADKMNAAAASFTFKPAAQAFVPGVASATPLYPPSRSGYVDDLDRGAEQPAPPKRQSFADLGLDSLGFVSDEEEGDAGDNDTASPLTKQRRDEVVQQLEGGMLYNQQRAASGEYQGYQPPEFHPNANEFHPQVAHASEYHPHQQEYHPHANEFHPNHAAEQYGYYPRNGYDEGGYHGDGYHADAYHESYGMDEHMNESEFLQFLMESYQGYSLESLTELLEANNGDIALTVEILAELDVEVEPPEPPALDDESTFPTLGGGGAAAPAPSTAPPAPPPSTSPSEEPFTGFTISGGMSNVREGVSGGGAPGARGIDENRKFADRLRTTAPAQQAETRGSVTVGYGSGNFSGRRVASSQPWVETGDAVSHMYATTREDAKGHLRARNMCFQQATQAYLSGNKALAKDLSRKGREHARLMAAAHANAAENIFRERNTGVGGSGPRMFDLHGLHVQEALSVLHRELGECAARGDGVAHVLVRTGHHTKGSRTPSRLPGAVAEYLAHRRVRFWEPQPGMLEVDVASGDFFS